jgi:hypothetical protein
MTVPRRIRIPTTAARLRRYLQIVECRYPRAWEQLDILRQKRARLDPWPAWCHVPLTTVAELIAPEGSTDNDLTRLVDVAIIGGLAAWRGEQDICQIDRRDVGPERDLLDLPDLAFTPQELCARLQRTFYLELPQSLLGSPTTGAMRGAFVHLDYDTRTRRADLRLLIEPSRRWTLGSVPLIPVFVPLTEQTLARCLESTVRDNVRRHDRIDRFAVAGEMAVALHGLARMFLGLLMHVLDPTLAQHHPDQTLARPA